MHVQRCPMDFCPARHSHDAQSESSLQAFPAPLHFFVIGKVPGHQLGLPALTSAGIELRSLRRLDRLARTLEWEADVPSCLRVG